MKQVAIVGLMGSGKTTVAELVADGSGRVLRDCDVDLVARVGSSAAEYATAHGLDALHEVEAEVLADALASSTPSVITAAASTIEVERCRAELAGAFTVWLRADVDVLVTRVRAQPHRPLRADVASQLRAQAEIREPLFASVADLTLDATAKPAALAQDIQRAIARLT